MLMIFCTTGIRCGELRNLNLKDVEFANDVVRIRHWKGDRERGVYLTKDYKGILNAYIRRWRICDVNGPLFALIEIKGSAITPSARWSGRPLLMQNCH